MVAAPLTSSLVAGAVVPMPTLVPLSKICEFVISAAASNLARLLTVPPAVVTGVVPVAIGCTVVAALLTPKLEVGGAAKTNAEAGSPPTVCASAAFSAYGTLSRETRGCSACPCACTPSQRASPATNRSDGKPVLVVDPSSTV